MLLAKISHNSYLTLLAIHYTTNHLPPCLVFYLQLTDTMYPPKKHSRYGISFVLPQNYQ